MWWCCGKPKINSPGCKFQKHKQKDDEMDDDEEKTADTFVKVKCESCKEIGHRASDCERDPNMRTAYDVADE